MLFEWPGQYDFLAERHVLIDGKLANYNVNLGSGVVHIQPGGALCIIPVHSQHRGRIFCRLSITIRRQLKSSPGLFCWRAMIK